MGLAEVAEGMQGKHRVGEAGIWGGGGWPQTSTLAYPYGRCALSCNHISHCVARWKRMKVSAAVGARCPVNLAWGSQKTDIVVVSVGCNQRHRCCLLA